MLKWIDPTVNLPNASPTTDRELIQKFRRDRDHWSFAGLVHRHASLVYSVCWRITQHHQDAEDAFQATFLLLAQKADELEKPEQLGNWLFGVAWRIANKARKKKHRRGVRETSSDKLDQYSAPAASESGKDTLAVIQQELRKLGDKYQSVFFLCDIQGVSRQEAAKRLGIPEGTVSSRLDSARKMLAERLTNRGITLSVTTIATAIHDWTKAAVAWELRQNTLSTVSTWINERTIPGPILALLTLGGMTMKVKITLATLVVVGISSTTMALWPQQMPVKVEEPIREEQAKKSNDPKPVAKDAKIELQKQLHQYPGLAPSIESWVHDDSGIILSKSEYGIKYYSFKTKDIEIISIRNSDKSQRLINYNNSNQKFATFSSNGGIIYPENNMNFYKIENQEISKENTIELPKFINDIHSYNHKINSIYYIETKDKDQVVGVQIDEKLIRKGLNFSKIYAVYEYHFDSKKQDTLYTVPIYNSQAGIRWTTSADFANTENSSYCRSNSYDQNSTLYEIQYTIGTKKGHLSYASPGLRHDGKGRKEIEISSKFINIDYWNLTSSVYAKPYSILLSETSQTEIPLPRDYYMTRQSTISYDGRYIAKLIATSDHLTNPPADSLDARRFFGSTRAPREQNPENEWIKDNKYIFPGPDNSIPRSVLRVEPNLIEHAILVWDVKSGKIIRQWDLGAYMSFGICFANKSNTLAIAEQTSVGETKVTTIGLWEIKEDK